MGQRASVGHAVIRCLASNRNLCRARTYTWYVSAIDPTSVPDGLTVLPPEDALRSAKPAPTDSDLVIDGLTDAEWAAFETALANRVSTRAARAVVVDTMAVSALMNASRNPERAAAYRRAINDDSILVSFVTITELRFGALRAGWGRRWRC